jgi:catechol 2,3-dioxygenase-like lactoylglutathione lyase family enzyme
MPILDHLGINVSDIARSKAFYKAALAPLGITPVAEFEQFAGYGGKDGKPDFWIGQGATDFQTEAQAKANTPVHIAFVAVSRRDVDAFYTAAVKAGGRDHGRPGLRPEYHPNYYGAFVLDPDGHNVEAVCHLPS